MLLVLFGPSCSGKSCVARIIGGRAGASIWTGRDYLRLAKNEELAWRRFLDLLGVAAGTNSITDESIVYVAGDASTVRRVVDQVPGAISVRLTADLPSLESRFAPRVGGTVSPSITAMLRRSLDATSQQPTHMAFDTAERSCESVAESILQWCADQATDAK